MFVSPLSTGLSVFLSVSLFGQKKTKSRPICSTLDSFVGRFTIFSLFAGTFLEHGQAGPHTCLHPPILTTNRSNPKRPSPECERVVRNPVKFVLNLLSHLPRLHTMPIANFILPPPTSHLPSPQPMYRSINSFERTQSRVKSVAETHQSSHL